MNSTDEQDDIDGAFVKELSERNTLPIPKLPLPKDFRDMSMFEQMAYTIPVLDAVVANKYQPTLQSNAAYFKGGRIREQYKRNSAAQRGTLTNKEVNMIVEILKWYVRRMSPCNDDQQNLSRHIMEVDEEVLPSLPPSSDGEHWNVGNPLHFLNRHEIPTKTDMPIL